jgi:ribosomal protein S18 acetylase RimI-like enzyme
MTSTLTLRPAAPADLPICADFWLAMFEEVGLYRNADFSPQWRERFVEYFSRRIAAGEARYTLALDGDRIVGTAGAMLADGYPVIIHGLRFGYIFGVRVEPAYRGRGLAASLTREAIAFLRSRGCIRIRLHASNAGRSIYERLGFTPSNEMQV